MNSHDKARNEIRSSTGSRDPQPEGKTLAEWHHSLDHMSFLKPRYTQNSLVEHHEWARRMKTRSTSGGDHRVGDASGVRVGRDV